MITALVDHLEGTLGRIESGHVFARPADEDDATAPVVHLVVSHPPTARGLAAVWTLGLANLDLRSPLTDRRVRMELFGLCADHELPVARRLLGAATAAVRDARHPLLRGQTLGPFANPARSRWLCVLEPQAFDAAFGECDPRDGGLPVTIAQLLGIDDDDAALVDHEGPNALAGRLAPLDPLDRGRLR